MRQWVGIHPKYLCRKHLLGEHVEQHMAAEWIKNGHKLGRLQDKGFIDPGRIRQRHDACAKEMVKRGYNHQSPLDYEDEKRCNNTNKERNKRDLTGRCKECRARMRR